MVPELKEVPTHKHTTNTKATPSKEDMALRYPILNQQIAGTNYLVARILDKGWISSNS